MCSTLALYATSMQQYAAKKKKIFDKNLFWVNSAYKTIPDFKFLAYLNYLIKKPICSIFNTLCCKYAAHGA